MMLYENRFALFGIMLWKKRNKKTRRAFAGRVFSNSNGTDQQAGTRRTRQ
jgi:hypothetical protein